MRADLCWFALMMTAMGGYASAAAPNPNRLAVELVQKMTDVITWNPWTGGDYFKLTAFSITDKTSTVRYESGNFTFSPIQTNGNSTIVSVGGHTLMLMPIRLVNVSANYSASCVDHPDDEFHQIVTSTVNPDVATLIMIRIDDECNGSIDDVDVSMPVKPFRVTSAPPAGPCPRRMSEKLSFHYNRGIRNQTSYVIRASLETSLANFKMC
uniref:Uncharacterized protein n=1 Tax=Lygus hesperus TaxID=30085 RepID=A0A146LSB4_LYGHE